MKTKQREKKNETIRPEMPEPPNLWFEIVCTILLLLVSSGFIIGLVLLWGKAL